MQQTRTLSAEQTKSVFAQFPSGVALLAARVEGQTRAMLVSTFTVGVSLEPPMVTAAIADTSTTWPVLREAPTIGVSILSSAHTELFPALRRRDPETLESSLQAVYSGSSALKLPRSAAEMEVRLAAEYPAGDHQIALLQILEQAVDHGKKPLVYHRAEIHTLEAPLPSAPAPTDVAQ